MAYNFQGTDHSNEFGTQDIADNKVICILAYIPILFWLPLVTKHLILSFPRKSGTSSVANLYRS